LQKRSYEAQDGSKRYVTEVVAQDIEFMGSKPQGAAQEPSGANSFGSEVIDDQEIPF
jgi:single-strand DNA-binding protein